MKLCTARGHSAGASRAIVASSVRVVLAWVALAGCAHAAAGPAIGRVVRDYVRERDFSGVVVVSEGGKILHAEATGPADRVFGAPNYLRTRFQIASVSKLFISVCVLRLADERRLNLDDHLDRYLTELPQAIGRLTIESLLLHTSGLPSEAEFRPWESLSSAEHVRRISALQPDPAMAGRYRYSNSGYVLLAGVIEAVSGMSYEEFLARELLAPAGLADTGFIVGDRVIVGLANGYARGLRGWRSPWRARHRGAYAPGGLYSTAADLRRLIAALQDDSLLKHATRAALFEARVSTGSAQQWASYGGIVSERNGRHYVLVAGSGEGGKAALVYAPETRLVVVILSNNGDVPVTEMTRDVVLAAEEGRAPSIKACALLGRSALTAMVGEYDFTGTGLDRVNGVDTYRVAFTLADDHAFLVDLSDESATMLCEVHPGQLRLVDTDEIEFGFAREASGAPVLVIHWGEHEYRAARRTRHTAAD